MAQQYLQQAHWRAQQAQQQQEQQPQQEQQQQQQQQEQRWWQEEQQRAQAQTRRGPARVTRVVDELMVFVSAKDEEGTIGLVFKPDKIHAYDGSALRDVGIWVGAVLPMIIWDAQTLLVTSVHMNQQSGHTPHAMSVG